MGKAKTTTVAGRAGSEGELTATAMVVVSGCGGVPKKEEWRRCDYVRREKGKTLEVVLLGFALARISKRFDGFNI